MHWHYHHCPFDTGLPFATLYRKWLQESCHRGSISSLQSPPFLLILVFFPLIITSRPHRWKPQTSSGLRYVFCGYPPHPYGTEVFPRMTLAMNLTRILQCWRSYSVRLLLYMMLVAVTKHLHSAANRFPCWQLVKKS